MQTETTHAHAWEIDQQLVTLIEQVAQIPEDAPVPPELVQNIAKYLGYEEKILATILISGTQPGTGSSTLKKLLSRSLGYSIQPDAGFYRRAIAHEWNTYLQKMANTRVEGRVMSEAEIWKNFESATKSFRDMLVDVFQVVTKPEDLRDTELNIFSTAQNYSEDPSFWERLPDEIVYAQIHGNRGESDPGYDPGVWQGKFTAAVDRLLGKNLNSPENPFLAYPLIRLLLTIDPQVAAVRVAAREGWTVEEAFEKNDERRRRDENIPAKVYGMDMSILHAEDILHLDTTEFTPAQEAAMVLALVRKDTKRE